MTTVTTKFVFYDDGIFPVTHLPGEVVAGNVAAYAISQGYAGDQPPAEPEPEPTPALPERRKRK